jgi:hypothetical protein
MAVTELVPFTAQVKLNKGLTQFSGAATFLESDEQSMLPTGSINVPVCAVAPIIHPRDDLPD